jgi:hydrogenase/urease accessory protein HupE
LRLFLLLLLWLTVATADEVRPSYLQIEEVGPQRFSVLFKVPARGDRRLSMQVRFPDFCQEEGTHTAGFVGSAYIERYSVACTKPLAGERITIEGLERTRTDLLLRMAFLDHTSQSQLLRAENNSYAVLASASSMQVVKTYTWLGITHILMGFDHLMFVFALLLLVHSLHKLLWTITAFTLAHSITLAGSSLGYLFMPQKPVEAMIALSILFLAVEIMHEKEGKTGITARYPWLIAFTFGLLHGFGFAGALSEIGLPQHARDLALIFFNVGVEIGQLCFIAVVLLLGRLLLMLHLGKTLEKLKTVLVYMIGTLSTFWLIERVLSF